MAETGVAETLSLYWEAAKNASDSFQAFAATDHNLIAEMPWEKQASATLGFSIDQLRFMTSLCASICAGYGLRLFTSPTLRHLYAFCTGVFLVYYPFGLGIIHVFPPALLTYLGMAIAPRRSGVIAWLVNFPYLLYLHAVNASGENWNAGKMDFTGGQMIVVLKLIAIAVCRSDSFKSLKEPLPEYRESHKVTSLPSLLSYFSYIFCCGNLLAGPFFEYAEYQEFAERRGVWDPKSSRPLPSTLGRAALFVAEACMYMALFLQLSWAGINVHAPWYTAQPLAVRMALLTLMGGVYQLRYYFSWKLSEASLTAAGFNFLGYGENGKPLWGRCSNVSFLGVWTADSARNIPLVWNTQTGNFLRRYVYERVSPRHKRPGFAHLLFTQMVSAIWHGLYPGYLIFFSGTATWIYASQIIYKAETHLPAPLRNNRVYHVLKVAWTNMCLDYMSAAFQLLDLKRTLEAYRSVYFIPHYICLVLCVLGFVVKPKRTKPSSKKD